MKNVKSILTSAAILALTLVTANASANPADTAISPKLRVEREFRQLETVLNRYIQNDVIKATDLEQMNRLLHYFMLEHPGVARIVRVNAGGHSVNDVSAGSPHSAPSRNISAQRWFQHISQTRRPYHSMDASSANRSISLFYAWPLFTGPERNVFSGAVAALIDFTAHTALIEDIQPFQIAHDGRPFFQHEWDEFDFIEEPLEIRGANGLTIRTMKPVLNRLDPIAQSTPRKGTSADQAGSGANADDDTPWLSANDNTPEGRTNESDALFDIIKKGGIALLILIALLLAYSTIAGRKKKRLAMDEPAPPPKPTENVVIVNMADKKAVPEITMPEAQPQQRPANTAPAQAVPVHQPHRPVDNIDAADSDKRNGSRRDSDREQHVIIANMLKLIREDFLVMDKKIQLLSQRISGIEDFITRQ
jgi:hypothetical protein